MIHLSTNELAALKRSLAALEEVLSTLDAIGAGIAAIHVDAAINQLNSNLEMVIDDTAPIHSTASCCASEHPLTSR